MINKPQTEDVIQQSPGLQVSKYNSQDSFAFTNKCDSNLDEIFEGDNYTQHHLCNLDSGY